MVGIKSYGAYIPLNRLSRDEIAQRWGGRSLGGEKAIAAYDEDSVTMAVAAALDCMGADKEKIDGLFLATTTSPYKEKQIAATVAAAVDLPRKSRTADFAASLRGATIAMNSAIDAVMSDSSDNILVTASDCRMATPKDELESQLGDGAAAIVIGNSDIIASVDGRYSLFNEFIDLWRTEADTFIRSWEDRFITSEGYMSTISEAISGIMTKYGLTPGELSKVVFYAPNTRSHASLAKSLGFNPKTQVQDPLFTSIGNTGTPAVLIMLVAALDEAKPGDKILVASYGDGSDAIILNVTEGINSIREKGKIRDRLAKNRLISYDRYLSWRGLMPVAVPRRPEAPAPAVTCIWRERKKNLALYGGKCRQCGAVQFPPQRVCVACQAKDDFEDYKFSNRTGRIFTYSIDYLASGKITPVVSAFVDFDGGGRIQCEVTDVEPGDVEIGMPVEMTFRRLSESGGIRDYFWKARPIAR